MRKILGMTHFKHLEHHIIQGYISSQQGIELLLLDGAITLQYYNELTQKNLARLQVRLKEWKVTQKITSVFFAVVFGWFSINTPGEDMVRTQRPQGRRTRKELVK